MRYRISPYLLEERAKEAEKLFNFTIFCLLGMIVVLDLIVENILS